MRPAHYHSQYNRSFEAETQAYNQRKYKEQQEAIWFELMDQIEAILGEAEYEKFYNSLPETAPTQTYIDICNTKLAELALEPVYQDVPAF